MGMNEMKIDVCVPSLEPLSEAFLQNIEANIPVNRILTSSVKGRGNARQDLINRVETEWFAFVDSDVILDKNWYWKVASYAGADVGAIEGLWRYDSDKRAIDWRNAMEKLASFTGRKSWKEAHDFRAFTGDTLVRTEAMKGIRIPDMNVYEDQFIQDFVCSKNYKWIRTKETVCNHNRKYNIEDAYECGKVGRAMGKLTLSKQSQSLFLLTPLKIGFCAAYTKNFGACKMELNRQYKIWKGVLDATRGY